MGFSYGGVIKLFLVAVDEYRLRLLVFKWYFNDDDDDGGGVAEKAVVIVRNSSNVETIEKAPRFDIICRIAILNSPAMRLNRDIIGNIIVLEQE